MYLGAREEVEWKGGGMVAHSGVVDTLWVRLCCACIIDSASYRVKAGVS